MHPSSDSVGALASALAKAQAERSFRYAPHAPLSSSLDIVRQTLGQHDIATLQTTAVDHASRQRDIARTGLVYARKSNHPGQGINRAHLR